MSTFPLGTRFLLVLCLFSSQIADQTSCLVLKNSVIVEYNEYCFHWLKTLASVHLIFCHVEIEEGIVERSMVSGSTCLLHINQESNHSTNSGLCRDFAVFTDSQGRDFTEDCISKTIPVEMFTVLTKLIICDKSQDIPQHLKKEVPLKVFGSTNALYVTKFSCWSAGPFYLPRRSLRPAADCATASWVFDTEMLPDMRGETVRAVTFNRLVFSVIAKDESDPMKRYDGIEINIFLEAAKILNFTWEMDEIAEEVSNKWGKLEDDKWTGGVMEEIDSGRADIALVAFWIYEIPGLEFIYSYSYLRLVFLVPRPTLLGTSWASLARPFHTTLWLSVGGLVLTFPLMAWTMERLYMMHHHRHRQSHSLGGYLLYTVGSLTGGSCGLASPRIPGPLKPLVTSWCIVVLLLYACYTSKIASILSIHSYEPPLDTVEQLVEQNFSWGRTYYVDNPRKFVKREDYWQGRFVEHYITYNTSDLRNLLVSHKFALYAQVLEGTEHILVDSVIDDDLVQDFRLMKEGLAEYRICTAVPRHSPLKHFYDRVVVRLFEHGFINNFKARALRKYQKSSYENFRVDPDPGLNSEPTVLALDDFENIFYILIGGWVLSSVCFALELYVHARSTKLGKR